MSQTSAMAERMGWTEMMRLWIQAADMSFLCRASVLPLRDRVRSSSGDIHERLRFEDASLWRYSGYKQPSVDTNIHQQLS